MYNISVKNGRRKVFTDYLRATFNRVAWALFWWLVMDEIMHKELVFIYLMLIGKNIIQFHIFFSV